MTVMPRRRPYRYQTRPCHGCGAPYVAGPRKMFCARCNPAYRVVQRDARRAHGIAMRLGLIERLDGRSCADCGQPAKARDHRDYTRALDTDPTCHRCNLVRGPGLPRNSIEHFIVEGDHAAP